MLWGKKRETPDTALDRLGSAVVRAAGLTDEEAREVAARLTLAGVRARARAGQGGGDEPGGWLVALLAARQAIPALLAVAAVAFMTCWLLGAGGPGPDSTNGVLPGVGLERVQAGSTCSISARDECAISMDDVLATIISGTREEGR